MRDIVKKPKLDLDFSRSKKKGANIENAVNSVGKINHAHAHDLVGGENLLKKSKRYKIDADFDGM